MIGLMPGMVMNRGLDDTCNIRVRLEKSAGRAVAYSGPSGNGMARLEPADGSGEYWLRGIPTGGPYTITLDGCTVKDVYVGDLWLLAGQSNMQGVGWYIPEDIPPDPMVRAFYMDNTWGPAKHPLHDVWHAADEVHTQVLAGRAIETDYQGVGPGVAFARRMYVLTGVPQGVLCCAHGGTGLADWDPDLRTLGSDRSLYGAMLRRFRANGAMVRGMFWFQGCQDAFDLKADQFEKRMLRFLAQLRADMGCIPVLQVQLGRVVQYDFPGLSENWMEIREIQRTLPEKCDRLWTLCALDGTYDDCIHLSAAAQNQLGCQAAEVLYAASFPHAAGGCLPPELDSIHVTKNVRSGCADILVTYRNVPGGIQASGRPWGYTLREIGTGPDSQAVFDVKFAGNTVRVRTVCSQEQLHGWQLYYGFGTHPYCNLTDGRGRSLPGFGPVNL